MNLVPPSDTPSPGITTPPDDPPPSAKQDVDPVASRGNRAAVLFSHFASGGRSTGARMLSFLIRLKVLYVAVWIIGFGLVIWLRMQEPGVDARSMHSIQ